MILRHTFQLNIDLSIYVITPHCHKFKISLLTAARFVAEVHILTGARRTGLCNRKHHIIMIISWLSHGRSYVQGGMGPWGWGPQDILSTHAWTNNHVKMGLFSVECVIPLLPMEVWKHWFLRKGGVFLFFFLNLMWNSAKSLFRAISLDEAKTYLGGIFKNFV